MFLTSSITFDVLIISTTLLLILYKYVTRNFDYWKKRGLHYVKPAPFVGNLGDVLFFRKTMHLMMKDLYDSIDEPYFGIFVFDKPGLMIKSPELIKNILVKDFSHFHDRSGANPKHNEVHSNLMIFQRGLEWKLTRNKMTTVFTSSRMKAMMPILTNIGEELQQHLNRSPEILEARGLSAKFVTEIIAQFFFGIRAHSLDRDNSDFLKYSNKAFEFTFRNLISQTSYYILPKVAETLRFDFVGQDVTKFFENAFWSAMKSRKQHGTNDLIDIMKELQKDEDFRKIAKFDDNKVVAQPLTFFLAALETISTSISFTYYELAKNQAIQDKLRTEILTSIEKHKGVTYDGLTEMKYMDLCIYETLRKYPTLPFLDRICGEDYQIPDTGFVIEKGVPVFIPLYAYNHDKNHFPDPEVYRPERYSDKSNLPLQLLFGAGPRGCIGERLGMINTKVGLIYTLSKYRLETTPETPEIINYEKKTFFLRAKDGIKLRYVKLD